MSKIKTYTLRGTVHGEPVEFGWSKGKPVADDAVMTMLQAMVDRKVQVSIPGLIGGEASLDDPAIAAATFYTLVDDPRQFEWTGDQLPQSKKEGAVA